MAFLSMLSITQATVVWAGLAAGLVVCVRGVCDGSLTVGDAVLFVTMMNQLYIPLTFFGSYYRQASLPARACMRNRSIAPGGKTGFQGGKPMLWSLCTCSSDHICTPPPSPPETHMTCNPCAGLLCWPRRSRRL